MYFKCVFRPACIIVCTLLIVIDSQSLIFSSITKPEKSNQYEDRSEIKTQVLHDYTQFADESLNYILPNDDYSRERNMPYYDKNQMVMKESVLNTIDTDDQGSRLQHLCIFPKNGKVTKNYKCKSTNFKSFACVGEGGKLELCNKYLINKQLNEPLCIKKNQFVVACNNPQMKSFCFSSHKNGLFSCDDENLKVCYTDYGFDYCKTIGKRIYSHHKRRSIQTEKIDPRNIQCSDCEVDILMEVYEGSTPMIEVKIKRLNGKIHTDSKDDANKA